MRIITLAKRLGLLSALRAPLYMLPKPDLSENIHRWMLPVLKDAYEHGMRVIPPGFLHLCARLVGFAGGRQRIPRRFQPA